ncbi:MAG TPA: PQQ-dependent sugar dehydrogenase [Vicinamibacteria bacterium]|nr:PQQ-dependent sugar dehydrogenase [Vicinamibacteria bacterium]
MTRAIRVAAVILTVSVAVGSAWALLLLGRFVVRAPGGPMSFLRRPTAAAPATAWRLHTPPGTRLTVFADGLKDARFLRFLPTGQLLVSTPREGEVIRLEPDRDGDGRSDGRSVLLSGLDRPHGMDLHEGWLYVAETGAVGRVRLDPATGNVVGTIERVVTDLPPGGNHWTRTVRFGPDGLMYVSVGSSCNVCKEDNPRRAAMLRYRGDGSGEEIFATGLRNSVGFDWRPEDGQLYATDNGRDLLGDDFPPCELNRVVQGGFYGWPIANGDRVPDPDFGRGQEARIAASIPPVHGFRAHNAPLGMVFLRSTKVPPEYRGAAIVALHGSWNRSRKDGYKVVSLHWEADGEIQERDFVTGFLGATDDDVVGRPVDATEGPDGAVYLSDDLAGAVYRVSWDGASAAPQAAGRVEAAEAPAASAASPASSAPLPAAAVERGEQVYRDHPCASCHEPQRAGSGVVVRPLVNLSRRYTPESLAAYLRTPNPPMPAFPLTDDEREALAAYLLARHP